MAAGCIQLGLEKRVQLWKFSAISSTVCRVAFVISLAMVCVGVLTAPRATVGNCYIIYSDAAKASVQMDIAKVEGQLGEVAVGSEENKIEAKLSIQGESEAMRQIRLRKEHTASNDNKFILEHRDGSCVNTDDTYHAQMFEKSRNMLSFKQHCWDQGQCFAESRTIDGEVCNCQSEHASASCQKKCFDECTVCNCADGGKYGEGSHNHCVQDIVLHQRFEWAHAACKHACTTADTAECIQCRQQKFAFIDKCSMANPQVGGTAGVCNGEVVFDYERFASYQFIENCTNPEGCQVYVDNDYAEGSANQHMLLEAWQYAGWNWWTDMDGVGSYPNVFEMKDRQLVPWAEHVYPGGGPSRRMQTFTMSGCKWVHLSWEPLTPQTWSSGSRQFQRESANHVETVHSSLGSSEDLDKCQTAGLLVDGQTAAIIHWDIRGLLLAQTILYLIIFAMKTFMLRNTWVGLNKELKEMEVSAERESSSLSQEVGRVGKATKTVCTRIAGCLLAIENLFAKIQGPFFFCYMTFMPAYILSPILQATSHEGYIIAPASDVWTIEVAGWWMLAASLWWMGCQILTQCCQKCKVISQFCNVVGMCPIAVLGAYVIYYELQKLFTRGVGFEFVLFFKHIFSFHFSFGLEASVDFVQLLFAFAVALDAWAGFVSTFTKRDWKEKCIFSCLVGCVKDSKAAEPPERQAASV